MLALASLTLAALTAPPFDDALVHWRLDGHDAGLTVVGDVALGVPLVGAEREASLERGGDGTAAKFNGGYLNAGTTLSPTGEAFSVCLRLRDPDGAWLCPLFAKHGGHDKLVFNVFSADLDGERVIGVELGTDGTKGMTQVRAPLALLGERDWHDVIARYDGVKLELFIDGVKLDEGFPMGKLRGRNDEPVLLGAESYGGQLKTGFRGLMDHAALWQRSLSEAEIVQLSGGAEAVAKRSRELIPDLPSMQYWRPENQFFVGDTLPYFHDGVFHFFYLQDRGHHSAKGGQGAHQWAQTTSTDLVHWQRQPLAIPISAPYEGSICTGSVFYWDGTWYGYYATRAIGRGEEMSLATSQDGVHFTKTQPNPFLVHGPRFGHGFRDPHVFRDPETGLFHLIVATMLVAENRGALAQYTSPDLKTWTEVDPLLVEGHEVPECPDYFEWNGRYYLIFSFGGVARYRIADHPLGPWRKPAAELLDGPASRVMKTAAFTGNRRIGTAFVTPMGYAGWAVFRELVQNADGTLGCRFVPEMMPALGEAGTLDKDGHGLPPDFHLRAKLTPPAGAKRWGLRVRGGEIAFEPGAHRAHNGDAALDGIEGLDGPTDVEVVLKGHLLDVCINQRHTIIRWLPEPSGDRLERFGDGGEVGIEGLEVRPLR
jgi:hypothetical protein